MAGPPSSWRPRPFIPPPADSHTTRARSTKRASSTYRSTNSGRVLHILDRPLQTNRGRGQRSTGPAASTTCSSTRDSTSSHKHLARPARPKRSAFTWANSLSTIDLDRAPLTPELVQKAEQAANEVVMSACPVTARFVDDARTGHPPPAQTARRRRAHPHRRGPGL